MNSFVDFLDYFTWLDDPRAHWPIAAACSAIVLWRLWGRILSGMTQFVGLTRKLKVVLQRYYLWVLIPGALATYIAVWYFLTGHLPFIVRDLIALLADQANFPDATRTTDIRNLAYAIAALLGAVAVLATIPFQLLKTWMNERAAQTTEQGHITDRLNKAIEMLGSEKTVSYRSRFVRWTRTVGERTVHEGFVQRYGGEADVADRIPDGVDLESDVDWEQFEAVSETVPNLEVRLGAIYALERIAQDSERDHITVMETLCAYIRNNAPASEAPDHDLGDWPEWIEDATEEQTKERDALITERSNKLTTWINALEPPRVDIQAALTVIGRRSEDRIQHERQQKRSGEESDPGFQLDLRNTNLRKADLRLARLDRALLAGARMEGAYLSLARMEGANLYGARMEGANLYEARMERADLSGARMEGAYLYEARMERAYLSGARMEGAYLYEARMERADLSGARMEGAYLYEARMERADLSGARMEGAYLYEARMERADLSGARMEGANLYEARMEGASLHSAVLTSAALSEGTLDATSLRAADVRTESLSQDMVNTAFGDAATTLPDGIAPPDHWDEKTLKSWETDEKLNAWRKAGCPPGKPVDPSD